MPRLTDENWRPHGVADLEQNAWIALRANKSQCLIAGPGSGKTELLAQRATYLIETGVCRDPQKILAISFKHDAAENLRERVKRRCPEAEGHRFTSLTFDAFTKGLVDRFRLIIPSRWRPPQPYEILFPKKTQIKKFLQYSTDIAPKEWRHEIAGITEEGFESTFLGQYKLPAEGNQASAADWVVAQWIDGQFNSPEGHRLSFAVINRLAELLLRCSPAILGALHLTFPYVFVDEFQDTTFAQFDLLRTAFEGTSTVITAVGDHKQRIMLWAGARPDSFRQFKKNFYADSVNLICNYRSSPELVRIQHFIASAIDPNSAVVESRAAGTVSGAISQIWTPANERIEAQQIAAWIKQDMTTTRIGFRDYAILVRQEADKVEARLAAEFSKLGLQLRNENRTIGRISLQDLLSEDVTRLVLALGRLIVRARDADAWMLSVRTLVELRERRTSDTVAVRRVENELVKFLEGQRTRLATIEVSGQAAKNLASELVEFLGQSALRRAYPSYWTGENLDIAIEGLGLHFEACAGDSQDWGSLIASVEGEERIPLMTVHKSKGLEYHTILFLGLDDEQWWAHTKSNPEGASTFFVAFSRAKQRAFFTCCRDKQKWKVADLHQLLLDAGVPSVNV